ncbi:MAG: hypothetical protein L0Z54_03270 [Thermoplasmata archaeon]|nr:hypothetical protein [Thermoplasmata archaeon]
MNSNDRLLMNIGLVITVIAVLGAAVAGGELDETDEGGNGGEKKFRYDGLNDTQTSDQLNEGSADEYDYLPGNDTAAVTVFVRAELTWTDEDPIIGFTNEPDRFNLTITAPTGRIFADEAENGDDRQGSIVITIEDSEWREGWTVRVTMVEAGDQWDPLHLFSLQDAGNGYELKVTFEFKVPL